MKAAPSRYFSSKDEGFFILTMGFSQNYPPFTAKGNSPGFVGEAVHCVFSVYMMVL